MRNACLLFCFFSLLQAINAGELRLPVRVAVPPPREAGRHPLEAGFRDMVRSALKTSLGTYVCPLNEQRTILKQLQAPDHATLDAIGVDCVIMTRMKINGEKVRITYQGTSRLLPMLDEPVIKGTVSGTVNDLPDLAYAVATETMKPWRADLRRPTIVLGTDRKVLEAYGRVIDQLELAACTDKLDDFIDACLSAQPKKELGLREFQWVVRLVKLRLGSFANQEKKREWFDRFWPVLNKRAGSRPLCKPFLAEALLEAGNLDQAETILAEFDTYLKGMNPVRFKLHKVYNVAREQEEQNVWTRYRKGDVLFVKKNPREVQAINIDDGSVIWRYTLPYGGYPGFFGASAKALYYRTLKDVIVLDKATGKELHRVKLTGNPYEHKWLQGSNGLHMALNKGETGIILLNMGVFHHREGAGIVRTTDAVTIEHVDLTTNTVKLLYKEHIRSVDVRYKLKGDVIMFSRNPSEGRQSWLAAYDITTGKEVPKPEGADPNEFGYGKEAKPRQPVKVKLDTKFIGGHVTCVATRLKDGKVIFNNVGQGADESVVYYGDHLYVLRSNRHLTKQHVDTGTIEFQVPLKDEYFRGFCKYGILLYSNKTKTTWCPNESAKSVDARVLRKAEYLSAICKEKRGDTKEAVTAYDALTPYVPCFPELLRRSAKASLQLKDGTRAWHRFESYLASLEGYAPKKQEAGSAWKSMQQIFPMVSRVNVDLPIIDKRSSQVPEKTSLGNGVLLSGPNAGILDFKRNARRFEMPPGKTPRYFTVCGDTALCQYASDDRGGIEGIFMVRLSDGKMLWHQPAKGRGMKPRASHPLGRAIWVEQTSNGGSATVSIAGPDPQRPINNVRLPGKLDYPTSHFWKIAGTYAAFSTTKHVAVLDLQTESIAWTVSLEDSLVVGMNATHLLVQGIDKNTDGKRIMAVFELKTGERVKDLIDVTESRLRPITTFGNKCFFTFGNDDNEPPPLVCFDLARFTVDWKKVLPRGTLDFWSTSAICDENYLLLPFHFRHSFRVVRVTDGTFLGVAKLPRVKSGALSDWHLPRFLENGQVSDKGLDIVVRKDSGATGMYRFRTIHLFLAFCDFVPEKGIDPITRHNDPKFVTFGNHLAEKRITRPVAAEILDLCVGNDGKVQLLSKGKKTGLTQTMVKGRYGSDGKELAVIDTENVIHLLDAATDKESATIKAPSTVVAMAVGRTHLAFSDSKKNLFIHDKETGKVVRSIKSPTRVTSLTFSLNGKRLAAGEMFGIVRLYDLSGNVRTTLKGHSFSVCDLQFLDDSRLASASDDLTIRIWNVKTGKSERELIAHDTLIVGITAIDGHLLSTDMNGTLIAWSRETWKPAITMTTKLGEVSAMSASPTGKVIVLGTRTGTLLTITCNALGTAPER